MEEYKGKKPKQITLEEGLLEIVRIAIKGCTATCPLCKTVCGNQECNGKHYSEFHSFPVWAGWVENGVGNNVTTCQNILYNGQSILNPKTNKWQDPKSFF
jgi:hypothetical protein